MRRCGSSGSGRRPNADEWALQGRLEAVAATVMDGETASRCAKKGAPASDTEKSALPESCWFTFVLGLFLARGALAPVTCRSACLQRPASTKASMNRRCKVVSGQWRRRSLTARRFRAAPRRALRRAIPRKVHFQRAAGLTFVPGPILARACSCDTASRLAAPRRPATVAVLVENFDLLNLANLFHNL